MFFKAIKNSKHKLTLAITGILIIGAGLGLFNEKIAYSDQDHVIYSTYRGVDLGGEKENSPRDYYVNMGSENGIRPGSTLEVWRKVPTYDLSSQKLYKDLTFPIARIKVIHVEANAAVARIETFYPPEKAPAMSPRAVMVGDLVRFSK